jgi:hypothetical protein
VQIHVHLIPIFTGDQLPAVPDPPTIIYHYTTGLKLRSIINSGCIKPTTAKIEPHEKPVAWFSTSPLWEPTATKVPIPGKQGVNAKPHPETPLGRASCDALPGVRSITLRWAQFSECGGRLGSGGSATSDGRASNPRRSPVPFRGGRAAELDPPASCP